ncbi:phosphopantetheine-binding protein [Citrobacter portucalensis]|uniref:phosphopantetheine-binding protein n=1 Tax=Citrobacter portucalensis TaxID=1639133 RepID=UPI00226B77AA|nr:phosphopantetheine-binding protein [Citrobacter portucalensis]MCX8985931.1 hypothetical protein [Citrobacter portucalensis]
MLTQQELRDIVLKKVSNLITVDVNDINLTVAFDQIGLDSLSLAVLFIELEQISGFDPFGEDRTLLSDIKNVNDIINIYAKN